MTSKLITAVVAGTIAAAASAAVYDVKFTVKTINEKGKFGTMTIQGAYDEATGESYFWDKKTKAPITGASFGAEMNVTSDGKKVLANAELVWDGNKSAFVVGSAGSETSLSGNFGGMIDEVPAYGTYSFKASKKALNKIVPKGVLAASNVAEKLTGSKMAQDLADITEKLDAATQKAEEAVKTATEAVAAQLKAETELATTKTELTEKKAALDKALNDLEDAKKAVEEATTKAEEAEARAAATEALVKAIKALADNDNEMLVTNIKDYLKDERAEVQGDVDTLKAQIDNLKEVIDGNTNLPKEVKDCEAKLEAYKAADAKVAQASADAHKAEIEKKTFARFDNSTTTSVFLTDSLVTLPTDTTAEKAKYVALNDQADIETLIDATLGAVPELPAYDIENDIVSGYTAATQYLAQAHIDYTNAVNVANLTNTIANAIVDTTNFLANAEAQLADRKEVKAGEAVTDGEDNKFWQSNITGAYLYWSVSFKDFFRNADFADYLTPEDEVKFDKGLYTTGTLSDLFDAPYDFDAPGSVPATAADRAKLAQLWKTYQKVMAKKLADIQADSEKAWKAEFDAIDEGIKGLEALKAKFEADKANILAGKCPTLDAEDKKWADRFDVYDNASPKDIKDKAAAYEKLAKVEAEAITALGEAETALSDAADAADAEGYTDVCNAAKAIIAGGFEEDLLKAFEQAVADVAGEQGLTKEQAEANLKLAEEALERAEAAVESIDAVLKELEKPADAE